MAPKPKPYMAKFKVDQLPSAGAQGNGHVLVPPHTLFYSVSSDRGDLWLWGYVREPASTIRHRLPLLILADGDEAENLGAWGFLGFADAPFAKGAKEVMRLHVFADYGNVKEEPANG